MIIIFKKGCDKENHSPHGDQEAECSSNRKRSGEDKDPKDMPPGNTSFNQVPHLQFQLPLNSLFEF
jgi:hypothetical protein